MLQETHSDVSVEEMWTTEYKGKIYFSHGSSSSRGVALLIPEQLNAQLIIKAKEIDKEGRILLIHIEINNRDTIIVNIYAPTKDNITLQNNVLVNLNKILENYNDKPMIIGGNFNINLSDDLDKRGGIGRQPSSYRDNLIQFIDVFSLVETKTNVNLLGEENVGVV